jgi:hypothetical protein
VKRPNGRDSSARKGDESAVGDGDAVVVATEIAQRVFRSAEGWLGIDDPVVAEQRPEPCGEEARLRKWCEVAVEREPILLEGGLQSGDELAAKNPAEDLEPAGRALVQIANRLG